MHGQNHIKLCFIYTFTNTVLSRAPQPFGRYCHQIPQSVIHPVKRHETDRQTSEQQGILTGPCATGSSNGTQKFRDVSSQNSAHRKICLELLNRSYDNITPTEASDR